MKRGFPVLTNFPQVTAPGQSGTDSGAASGLCALASSWTWRTAAATMHDSRKLGERWRAAPQSPKPAPPQKVHPTLTLEMEPDRTQVCQDSGVERSPAVPEMTLPATGLPPWGPDKRGTQARGCGYPWVLGPRGGRRAGWGGVGGHQG